MEFEKLFSIIKELDFDTEFTVLTQDNCRVFVLRPSKVSTRFKNYDPKRNFQIWLNEGTSGSFKPKHLRVFLDLNLRVRGNPEIKEELLLAFDDIFHGVEPKIALKDLINYQFEHFLNTLPIIGQLSQLFIIEQIHGYTSSKKSKYDPPSLYFQGWVRTFIDGPRKIDDLIASAGRNQPPSPNYTKMDDRNRKEYCENPPKLWYLGIDEKLDSFVD